MKLVKLVVCVMLPLVATACSTTAVPLDSAVKTPADRVLAYQNKDSSHNATIVVIRDEGYTGGGCFYSFYINDVLAARFDTSETANFYVAPGEQVLRSGRDPLGKGLCGVLQGEWTQRETVLKESETKYFRLSIDANGKTDIQRTDPKIAP